MADVKICICGWRFAAGKCPYPINCKIKVEPFQVKPQAPTTARCECREG